MEQDYKKEIEKIMMGMTCQKDFECYKSGFRYLCKTQDAGTDDFLICLEDQSHECSFSSIVGKETHCGSVAPFERQHRGSRKTLGDRASDALSQAGRIPDSTVTRRQASQAKRCIRRTAICHA